MSEMQINHLKMNQKNKYDVLSNDVQQTARTDSREPSGIPNNGRHERGRQGAGPACAPVTYQDRTKSENVPSSCEIRKEIFHTEEVIAEAMKAMED